VTGSPAAVGVALLVLSYGMKAGSENMIAAWRLKLCRKNLCRRQDLYGRKKAKKKQPEDDISLVKISSTRRGELRCARHSLQNGATRLSAGNSDERA